MQGAPEDRFRTLNLSARKVFGFLIGIDLLLMALHVLGTFIPLEPSIPRYVETDEGSFNLGAESSIPTWWSSAQLGIAAALALTIGAELRSLSHRHFRYWFALGAVLMGFSVDEIAMLHERIGGGLTEPLGITSGPFIWSWVIVGMLAVVVFGAVFIRFWLQLPPLPRLLLAIGGGLFVLGALFVEMIGANYYSDHGFTVTLSLIGTVEEGLEMIGISVTLLGLLTMMRITPGLHIPAIEISE